MEKICGHLSPEGTGKASFDKNLSIKALVKEMKWSSQP